MFQLLMVLDLGCKSGTIKIAYTVSLPMPSHAREVVSIIRAASHWSKMHWQSRYPVLILKG